MPNDAVINEEISWCDSKEWGNLVYTVNRWYKPHIPVGLKEFVIKVLDAWITSWVKESRKISEKN